MEQNEQVWYGCDDPIIVKLVCSAGIDSETPKENSFHPEAPFLSEDLEVEATSIRPEGLFDAEGGK